MRKLAPFFAAILMLVASTAHAQQAANLELDRGTVTISQLVFPNATYNFAGQQSSVQSFIPPGDVVATPSCTPCLGGDTVIISGSLNSETPGTFSVNNLSRDLNVYVRTILSFTAGSITIPYRYSRLPIRFTIPATVSGSLTGYARDPNLGDPGPPVFTTSVSLQGTVTVTLLFRGNFAAGKPIYSVQKIVYNFPPQA